MDKKTECEIVQDLLLGYVDDVLNPESKKIVEKHLFECAKCQTKLQEIKKDIESNENNQKKQIDYLKKIRRKNYIKAILIAIGMIFFICLVIYLRKFIIVNDFINKANISLASENFYIETANVTSDDRVVLTKEWYKDGKYKIIRELYSDEGVKIDPPEYATINTDERIIIDHENKIVTIEKGEFTEIINEEKSIGNQSFGQKYNLVSKLRTAFFASITTSTYSLGREYYILTSAFDKNSTYEQWIDKDTGLPLRISGKGKSVTFFKGTNIVKEEFDNRSEYKYEFNIVTDEDVSIPDYTGYEVKYVSTDVER